MKKIISARVEVMDTTGSRSSEREKRRK